MILWLTMPYCRELTTITPENMAALFALFLSLVVFSASSSSAKNTIVFHDHVSIVRENFIPTFTDSTFSVQNQTTADVGWLTITVTGSTYSYINITGAGTFSTTLSNYAANCAIHGQTFAEGTPTTITIDAHTTVRVTWTGSIIVVDQEITH